MPMELVFLIGIAVLLILCIKVKANAFVALLVTGLIIGVLSGMSGSDTVEALTTGFSGTVKSIGIIIIFGIMLGNYLDAAKGTNRMALDAIRLVGQKRAGLAMAITGYIVSIPVFSDAAFVILTPLVKAINKKTRIPLAILAVSLSSGLLATHVYVPPTPGPLAAAGLLGIDIGEAILYGAFAAVFMTAFGWIFAELYFKKKPDSFYTFREGEVPEAVGDDADDTSGLPGTLASLLPLVVPILLIISKTTCDMLFPADSLVVTVTSFVGDSNIALALGAVLAIITLGRRMGGKKIIKVMDDTLKDAGPIVFITAAGGALGQVLKVSGAGDSLATMVINTGLPFILIPFVISGLLKVVQGSGTVAVTTAATLCAPIAASLGLNPILIFLASGAGARVCCHVNDSFFWVYTNCMGYDMKTGLKTLSISNIFMSIGGLVATFICSLWL
ncbi:GntP family permease [Lacrimispora indolis]|uniref:GntP family permease n=1 Tax=Lacrimispora indolis TaxID=69825 RepID=UPI00040F1C9E|nr:MULTISPECIES: gluconate:H+ symporter [Lachnospiraceae]